MLGLLAANFIGGRLLAVWINFRAQSAETFRFAAFLATSACLLLAAGCARNEPPAISVGPDLNVYTGEPVTLTGEATHPEGSALAYRWEQVEGEPVEMRDAQGPNSTFIAPVVATDAAANGTVGNPRPSAPFRPTPLAYTICMETSRSGSRIAGIAVTRARRLTAVPGQPRAANVAYCGAVLGSTSRGACAPRPAVVSLPGSGATTSVSAWPGHSPLESAMGGQSEQNWGRATNTHLAGAPAPDPRDAKAAMTVPWPTPVPRTC